MDASIPGSVQGQAGGNSEHPGLWQERWSFQHKPFYDSVVMTE